MAVVVKYADNLLKGFATSISIVLSCIFSTYLSANFRVSTQFVFGALLVICSTIMYGTKPTSLLQYLHHEVALCAEQGELSQDKVDERERVLASDVIRRESQVYMGPSPQSHSCLGELTRDVSNWTGCEACLDMATFYLVDSSPALLTKIR